MIQQLYFQQTVKQTSMNYKNASVLISWKYKKGVVFTLLEANTLLRHKSIKERLMGSQVSQQTRQIHF